MLVIWIISLLGNFELNEFNIEEQGPVALEGFLDTTVSPGVGQLNLKDPWLLE